MKNLDLFKLVLASGNAIRLAFGKAAKIHPLMLCALAESDDPKQCKKQTAEVWRVRFCKWLANHGLEMPLKDATKPESFLSDASIRGNASKYTAKQLDAAHYLNNFQNWLRQHKLIEVVKADNQRKNSKVNIVPADKILSLLAEVYKCAPKDKAEKVLTHLHNAAKQFGIANPDITVINK